MHTSLEAVEYRRDVVCGLGRGEQAIPRTNSNAQVRLQGLFLGGGGEDDSNSF